MIYYQAEKTDNIWVQLVTVWEEQDGKIEFIGRCYTNDVDHGVAEIIKDRRKN